MAKLVYDSKDERQYVTLEYEPNMDAESSEDRCGTRVNPPADGMGMDRLIKAVSEDVPTARNPRQWTTKRILSVRRDECPCCRTDMDALVDVVVEGLYDKERRSITGLYKVKFGPDFDNDGEFGLRIYKLEDRLVQSEKQPELPRRDYLKK